MKTNLHTVLGASGAVGQSVLQVLKDKEILTRAVARSQSFEGVENLSADLLNRKDVDRAVANSSVVYLCVGLQYNTEVWKRDWPLLMKNVIDACIKYDAVLVFLDNVYMYGPAPLSIPFDENHEEYPTTGKGKVRKEIDDMLMMAFKERQLKGVIARAADFFGPKAINSVFYVSFLERMLKRKAPQSFLYPGIKHTYANTVDLGRAIVELALEPSAYGQVWHLPVGDPISVEEMCEVFNEVMGTSYRVSFIGSTMLKIISLVMPILKEFDEMLYQFKEDYIMSYEKFQTQFPDFKPTPYRDVARMMVESFRK